MKPTTTLKLATILLTLAYSKSFSSAAETGHDHAHPNNSESEHAKKEAGPNGGRVVDADGAELEFLVREDGKIQITFLDHGYAIAPPKEQSVSLIGGDRSAPSIFNFPTGRPILVSDEPIPDIKNMPVILSIKNSLTDRTVRERFNLNLSTCPECDYKEYACVCEHGEGHHDEHKDDPHGHDH